MQGSSKTWFRKFANAFRGVRLGIVGHSSFYVHFPVAVAVLIIALLLRCEAWQWCMLGLCIGLVLSLELLNSAVESLRGDCVQSTMSTLDRPSILRAAPCSSRP